LVDAVRGAALGYRPPAPEAVIAAVEAPVHVAGETAAISTVLANGQVLN
jgi:hypothetical protein